MSKNGCKPAQSHPPLLFRQNAPQLYPDHLPQRSPPTRDVFYEQTPMVRDPARLRPYPSLLRSAPSSV